MYGLPQNVRVVPVIPVCILLFLPYVCLCFCMSEVISSFRSLEAGSQVFGSFHNSGYIWCPPGYICNKNEVFYN